MFPVSPEHVQQVVSSLIHDPIDDPILSQVLPIGVCQFPHLASESNDSSSDWSCQQLFEPRPAYANTEYG